MKNFSVTNIEGKNYAKLSGDRNFIHTDKITGYNSLFGHNIVYGTLIILKFLNKVKINKNYLSINIVFNKAFKYNDSIEIKKKNNLNYKLLQNNEICCYISFSDQSKFNTKLKKATFQKKYIISQTNKKKFSFKGITLDLSVALLYLSKYVGNIYPGSNSLISQININIVKKLNHNNRLTIESKLLDKRFPLIDNLMCYNDYNISFKTLIRPSLKVKLKEPKKKIIKEIKSIKKNILIIGASSGIGNDLLRLFLQNKKINIFATFFKNTINISQKNLIKKKIDITKDSEILDRLISKNQPIMVYYFPTPKIYNQTKNKKLIELYNDFYVTYPSKIIKNAKECSLNFFYPSSIYVNNKKLSSYARSKLKGEKEILKIQNSNLKINILRIPEINTKQNLSLLNKKLTNFRDLISKNKIFYNKIFFKDKE